MAAHGPLTGLPDHMYTLEPQIGPHSKFLMLPQQTHTPDPAPALPQHFWSSATREHNLTFLSSTGAAVIPQEDAADLPSAAQLPEPRSLTV